MNNNLINEIESIIKDIEYSLKDTRIMKKEIPVSLESYNFGYLNALIHVREMINHQHLPDNIIPFNKENN